MKDPIAYQAIAAMEPGSSTSEPDKYYPQDDVSESIRHGMLTGKNTDGEPWYDPEIHGFFSEDGS